MEVLTFHFPKGEAVVYRIGTSENVSIIIPNRKGLPPNIESVRRQTLKDYEIIVVSGRGTPGSSAARNLGLKMSKARFVAFLDDDAYPEPDWLEQLMLAYEKSGGGVIENTVVAPKSTFYGFENRLKDLQPKTLANFALYPRYVIDKVGLFDERFDPRTMNEIDYSLRIRKAGFIIRHSEKAKAVHQARKREFRSRGFSFRALLFFMAKHPFQAFLVLLMVFPLTHWFWARYVSENPAL